MRKRHARGMRTKEQALSLFRQLVARWPFAFFIAGCGAIVAGTALLIGAPVALLVLGVILVAVGILEVVT